MMKNSLLLLIVLMLAGCDKEPAPKPQQTHKTENGYQVELLFKHDGYKIYRFYDSGYYQYFVVSDDSIKTSWKTTRSDGDDTIIENHGIQTISKK